MTGRDELRVVCIETMNAAFNRVYDYEWDKLPDDIAVSYAMSAAFDSLHGLARVCPAEATPQMEGAGYNAAFRSISACWHAMSIAGDLTNQPETKP